MEMESSRRPFDRSREPGLKKPRLSDESERNQGLNRPFAAAQRPVANNPMVSRLRAAERESDGGDSGRGGGGYQPQPLPAAQQQQHQELVSQYRAALDELTFNSKPIITNLTIIAGENVHAAKAITATICANIIEVPRDQKLPSLYLLDSIVKNIGRDYIKHFAAKLPEVFCKAYRQVDPPIHQSMRHLFGTWKGVFPPQTLQMIEKELAFASAINGTSAGPTTSRPDSQANRPSIHVNPKYLERRLQQPNQAKGLSNDVSGSIVNSLEDAESMDRATRISTGRSWVDPSAKMHNMQRSHRGSEGIHEKNISAEYADYDHGSDFRRNSGLGIDRVDARIVEQGHEKPWYPDSSNLTESLSGQRNSYNIKHGFPNYSAPKPANLQSTKSIVSRCSGGMSMDSWKNSDEEEFRWGDMNSRLTEQGASDISSNFRKDRSTSVDSDRSGIEDHNHRSQSVHDYASRIYKEVSAEQKDFSTHGHRISSPWLSQDSPTHPGPSSFGYPGNGALGSGGAPPQQRFQSLKSGPSSLRQHPPSPSLTTHHLHLQLPGSAEQDRSRTQSLGHSDPKVSQFPGKFNTGMHDPYTHDTATILPSHGQPGKVVKSQANEALVSSSIPGIHQRHQYALPHQVADPTESEPLNQIQKLLPPHISDSGTPSTLGSYAPDRLNAHPVNTIEDSSPSSLLAAVMKSGVLSNSSITTSSLPGLNLQNTGQLPPQKGQSPIPSEPTSMMSANPRSKVSPLSSVGNSSHDIQSASIKISLKKVELSGSPSSSSPLDSASENSSKDIKSAPDPISNLLSTLVAKGLISASKTESPTLTPPKAVTSTETQKKSPSVTKTSPVLPSSVSSSTVLPTRDEGASVSEPSPTKPVSLPESTKSEIKNLIGFDFKPDVIRVFHPTVVSDLLDGYEHSCTRCGLRMKLQERLNQHLEWHDTKKTETDGPIKASRKWYASSSDWISAGSGHTSIESVDEHGETTGKDEPMVPADESNCVCVLCGEIFKDFYCQESDEWMFEGAKHMMIPSGGGEIRSVDDESLCKGPIVHAKCITESSLRDLGLASRIKTETGV